MNKTQPLMLNGLSSTKATGLDKISSKVLKAAASTIAPSLKYIFNNSIFTCCFPFDWKMARPLPVYNHGAFLKTIDQFQFCPQ